MNDRFELARREANELEANLQRLKNDLLTLGQRLRPQR